MTEDAHTEAAVLAQALADELALARPRRRHVQRLVARLHRLLCS